MKNYFQTLASYNQWANSHIYEACSQLTAEEYLKNRKAFFGSIHGTLNHLLVGDKLWLGRFQSIHSGIKTLDQILYPDLDSLHAARQQEDIRIIEFIEQCDPACLLEQFEFKTLSGKSGSMPMMWLLSHLFNHQTHHRGQVHNMLSQTGLSPPSIDLCHFLIDKK